MPLLLSHGEYMLGYRRRGMEVGVDEAPQGRGPTDPAWATDVRDQLRLSTKSGPPVIPKSGPPAIDGRSYFVSSRT